MKPRDPLSAKGPIRTPRRGDDRSTAAPPTRALVILPDRRLPIDPATAPRSSEARLAEAVSLAEAIGLDVCAALIVPLRKPTPATLIGTGKVEEIAALHGHQKSLRRNAVAGNSVMAILMPLLLRITIL